MNTIN